MGTQNAGRGISVIEMCGLRYRRKSVKRARAHDENEFGSPRPLQFLRDIRDWTWIVELYLRPLRFLLDGRQCGRV